MARVRAEIGQRVPSRSLTSVQVQRLLAAAPPRREALTGTGLNMCGLPLSRPHEPGSRAGGLANSTATVAATGSMRSAAIAGS
jgi:hypothetical protein